MAIDEKQFKRLKAKADAARAARDKAAGGLEATMQQLAKDFDVETVEDGEKLLATLRKDAARAEQAYTKAATAFEEKWDDQITDD